MFKASSAIVPKEFGMKPHKGFPLCIPVVNDFCSASLLATLLFLSIANFSQAESPVSAPDCSAGVCVLNVLAPDLVTAPCEGDSILIAYSTITPATLIQCSADDLQDNKTLIYERHNHEAKSFELDGARFVRPDALSRAVTEGIPDKFAPVPLCDAKLRENATEGTLVIVEKRPTGSDDKPYCYRVHYVKSANAFSIRSEEGRELPALSAKDSEQWTQLREKLSSYIPEVKSESTKLGKPACVSAEKARLYTTPEASGEGRMYLVKGDKVEIVDESKASQGWYRIRYLTKTGKPIDRWARAQDLEVSPK